MLKTIKPVERLSGQRCHPKTFLSSNKPPEEIEVVIILSLSGSVYTVQDDRIK